MKLPICLKSNGRSSNTAPRQSTPIPICSFRGKVPRRDKPKGSVNFVVRTVRPAENDALEIAFWFEDREAGLGYKFLEAVADAADKLSLNALLYRPRRGGIRRIPVSGFENIGIFFQVCAMKLEFSESSMGAATPKRFAHYFRVEADVRNAAVSASASARATWR